MLKWLKRLILNQPNSRLQTLLEHKGQECMYLRNWGNSLFCEAGWKKGNFVEACDGCIFHDIEPNRLKLAHLVAELDQLNDTNI